MQENRFDVIIIGAGAAGLIAALELALTGRTVGVVEAKERSGGRMNTVYTDDRYPIELGAEFVHGDLPLTLGLLKKAGVKTTAIRGSFWQHKEGRLSEQGEMIEDESELEKKLAELKQDVPVADFLSVYLAGDEYKDLRFTLQNYVQGYDAADLSRASTFALRDDLTKNEGTTYRIEGGYQKLVDYLEMSCREKGVRFFFSESAKEIQWRKNSVSVITHNSTYASTKVIITVPIGVLAVNSIAFAPALPEIIDTAQHLGFGHVVKIILEFDEAFWKDKTLTKGKDLSDANFLLSEEAIPTWWTQHPRGKPVLAGWLGGPRAEAFRSADKSEIEKKALAALSRIFALDVLHLAQKLERSYFHNWQADAHFCGAYSYEVVGGEALQKRLLQPVENTVFFAGEGLHHGPEIGTVEAALQSGQSVARNLIANF